MTDAFSEHTNNPDHLLTWLCETELTGNSTQSITCTERIGRVEVERKAV